MTGKIEITKYNSLKPFPQLVRKSKITGANPELRP